MAAAENKKTLYVFRSLKIHLAVTSRKDAGK